MRISETKNRFHKYLLLVASSLFLTAWGGGVIGQEESAASLSGQRPASEKTNPEAGSSQPALQRSRERWKKLRPAKRREMKRLFERLEDLPPQQRKRLIRRLRSLDAADRRKALRHVRENVRRGPSARRGEHFNKLLERLPPDERKRVESLPPDEKRQYVRQKMAARWKRTLSRLPPDVRERVEKMSPRARREFLQRRHLRRLLRRTFQDPSEVSRLRSLPPRRVRAALTIPDSDIAPRKPGFLSAETWRRWLRLEPRQRSKVLQQLLRQRPEHRARDQREGRTPVAH
jgi:hypothetical protein